MIRAIPALVLDAKTREYRRPRQGDSRMKSLFFAVVALAATAALAPNALAVNVRNCDETASVQTLA